MTIYIASDHGGFELKKTLVNYLKALEVQTVDMGPLQLDENDDYPDYVIPTINKLLEQPQDARAILLCRNGVGVSMLANKYMGIRCTLSWTAEHARTARADDDTNVLAIPADYVNDEVAKQIVEAWLGTPFSRDERHVRRLSKFSSLGDK